MIFNLFTKGEIIKLLRKFDQEYKQDKDQFRKNFQLIIFGRFFISLFLKFITSF